jgi:hypothetical protein
MALADNGLDIIGGQAAQESDYKEIVRISCGAGPATGTIVGYQAILISAHMMPVNPARCRLSLFNGQVVEFTAYGLIESSANLPSIDLAIGVLDKQLFNLTPATIGAGVSRGESLVIAGFGCTQPGGGGPLGDLHAGVAEMVQESRDDSKFATRGSAVCFGDSGAPAYSVSRGGEPKVVGIAAAGNMRDQSWFVDLTRDDIRQRLLLAGQEHNVELCGLNSACEAYSPDIQEGQK